MMLDAASLWARHDPTHKVLSGNGGAVLAVDISLNSRFVASGESEAGPECPNATGAIRVWTLSSDAAVQEFWIWPSPHQSKSVGCVRFARSSERLFSGGGDSRIRIWDLQSKAEVGSIRCNAPVHELDVTREGDRVVSCHGALSSSIFVWDAARGDCVRELRGHSEAVFAVSLSGRRLASGGFDRTVREWDFEAGRESAAPFEGHGAAVRAVASAPDGSLVASGGSDGLVLLWAHHAREPRRLSGHAGGIACLAVSPDSSLVASGALDKGVRLWNAATGAPVRELAGHSAAVSRVAISASGRCVVSGSRDGTLRVWSLPADAGTPHCFSASAPYATIPTLPTSNGMLSMVETQHRLHAAVGDLVRGWAEAERRAAEAEARLRDAEGESQLLRERLAAALRELAASSPNGTSPPRGQSRGSPSSEMSPFGCLRPAEMKPDGVRWGGENPAPAPIPAATSGVSENGPSGAKRRRGGDGSSPEDPALPPLPFLPAPAAAPASDAGRRGRARPPAGPVHYVYVPGRMEQLSSQSFWATVLLPGGDVPIQNTATADRKKNILQLVHQSVARALASGAFDGWTTVACATLQTSQIARDEFARAVEDGGRWEACDVGDPKTGIAAVRPPHFHVAGAVDEAALRAMPNRRRHDLFVSGSIARPIGMACRWGDFDSTSGVVVGTGTLFLFRLRVSPRSEAGPE